MIPKIINRFKKVKTPGLPNNKKSLQDNHLHHNFKFDRNPIVDSAVKKFMDKKIPHI